MLKTDSIKYQKINYKMLMATKEMEIQQTNLKGSATN